MTDFITFTTISLKFIRCDSTKSSNMDQTSTRIVQVPIFGWVPFYLGIVIGIVIGKEVGLIF